MALSKSEKAALDELLAKGDTVGAHNLLAGKLGAEPIEPAGPASDAPSATPRDPAAIYLDLFTAICHALGNRGSVTKLLDELIAVTTQAATQSDA